MLGGRAGVTKHPGSVDRHQGEVRVLWFVPGAARYLGLERGEQRQWDERKPGSRWRGLGHKGPGGHGGPITPSEMGSH